MALSAALAAIALEAPVILAGFGTAMPFVPPPDQPARRLRPPRRRRHNRDRTPLAGALSRPAVVASHSNHRDARTGGRADVRRLRHAQPPVRVRSQGVRHPQARGPARDDLRLGSLGRRPSRRHGRAVGRSVDRIRRPLLRSPAHVALAGRAHRRGDRSDGGGAGPVREAQRGVSSALRRVELAPDLRRAGPAASHRHLGRRLRRSEREDDHGGDDPQCRRQGTGGFDHHLSHQRPRPQDGAGAAGDRQRAARAWVSVRSPLAADGGGAGGSDSGGARRGGASRMVAVSPRRRPRRPPPPRDCLAAKPRIVRAAPAVARKQADWIVGIEPWKGLGYRPCRSAATWPGRRAPGTSGSPATVRGRRRGSSSPRTAFCWAGSSRLLAVRPEASGKGIGQLLVGHVEARVFDRRRWLFVSCDAANVAALRFYRRQGFARVGRLPDLVQAGRIELLLRKGRSRDPRKKTGKFGAAHG